MKQKHFFTFFYESKSFNMTQFISYVFLFAFIFPLWIQCQSGTFKPAIGRIDSLRYVTQYRMMIEPDCIALCLRYTSPSCYAVSYESFRQECRIITQPIPPNYSPEDLFTNWRSYILTKDF